jgi:ECF transporter S component (folate family)
MSNANKEKVEKLLFSKLLRQKNRNHKLAYVALITSLVVVANMFFEFKFMDVQFSLTIAVSAFAGILLGPLLGFAACFLGDLVGFLYNSAGFVYMPWIGISMGLTALIAGFIMQGVSERSTWFLYVKIALIALLSFFICTIGAMRLTVVILSVIFIRPFQGKLYQSLC